MRHGIREFEFRNKRYVLLPFSTLRYAFVGCALLTLLIIATEFFAQRECAIGKTGVAATYCPEWQQENSTIGRLAADRILEHDTDVIWRSALFQPPQGLSEARKRILVIGDSFVEGDGLSNVNITWWRELQRELERRGYWDVDIIAAGRNGASTQDQAEWVEKRGIVERFRPDAVLLGFITNDPDIVDENGKHRIRQFIPARLDGCLPSIVTALLQPIAATLYGRILDKCKDRAGALREARGEEFRYSNWLAQLYRPDNLAPYATIVGRLVKVIRRKAPNFIVVPLVDGGDEIRGNPVYQEVAQMFAREGAHWVDLGQKYLSRLGHGQESEPGMIANPANAHPGPILTRFYATQIADMLELEYPGALGGRAPMPITIKPRINDAVPADIALEQDGANAWSFRLLDREKPSLKWPISREHAHISFERAVSAERLTFQSPVDISLAAYGHFIDEADGHTEITARYLGGGSGRYMDLIMPEDLKVRRLMSLRIAAEAIDHRPVIEWEMPLVARAVAKEGGKAYTYKLSGIPYPGADVASPYRQILTLYENGSRLGPGASIHDDIRQNGAGRYSHWGKTIYFSASDNSDPRTNGRVYRLRKFAAPSRISMAVQFGSPPVRP